jgi:ABC-type polysaccharide/polyol phosphate export permease
VAALSLALRGWGGVPALAALLPALPLLFVFGWGVSRLAGFVNVAFRDTQHILEVVFQVLFYLTPIIYPAEVLSATRVGWVLACNPLVPFLDLVREPLVQGVAAPASAWLAAGALTLTVGAAAAASLGPQQRRVVLYL